MRRMTGERGVAAIIVMVSMIAIFVIGAIVVDIAALLAERRGLQNSADAAVLAIAAQCGAGGDCADVATTAGTYVNANADDNASTVDELCGTGIATLDACVDPPAIPAGANYVAVKTKTSDGSGGDQIPFSFGKLIGSNGGTMHARAVAAWGGPSALTSSLPVTMSRCEYDSYTNSGADLKPPPPYTSGYPSPEAVIYLHDTTGASPCPEGPAGSDLPGGFGWLDTSTGCDAVSDTSNWFDDSTGRPPPTSCTWQVMASMVGTVVALPIFDQTNGLTGTNGQYHMEGYAAFYVTGYYIVGQYKVASLASGQYPCSGQASCISGFFVDEPAPVEGTIGGPSMGVTVVELVR